MEDLDGNAIGQLTAEMAWLRRLARALLRDGDADDLAHDVFLVAQARPPASDQPLRPWLARVLVNLVRMRARSRTRRERREAATGEVALAVRPDDLVQRVELQQLVAGAVLDLAEPYRSTVLLHFFEELTCAEIARRLGIPEGTVRRRLKTALDDLRARLGAKDRNHHALVVLAAASPLALGALAMKKIVAVVVVLVLVLIAGFLWRSREPHAPATPIATADRGGSATGSAGSTTGSTIGRDGVPSWLAQLDVKPRRIAGRVTFHGAPVAGAVVELASVASEAGLVAAPHQTTDATGGFDFGALPAMAWSVRASAVGKSSARQDIDLRDPGATPDPARLELQLGTCTAALIGTVRDASGGPIAKARIANLALEGGIVPGGPAAVTDDNGGYELCVEARWPGWVDVEVSADGYAAITYPTIVAGRLKLDFALVPEAVIVGRVIRGDTGAPIAQAYVYVAAKRGPQPTPLRSAFADASGHFRIDRVAAGSHLVFARADGMAESTHGTSVAVGVGQVSVELEIRLEAGSTIRGRVADHDKSIAGAHVAAGGALAVSQDDGSFVLAGVPRGEIKFTAYPYDVVSPQVFAVTQPAHDGVTIEVVELGSIVGRVVRNQQPVPGATIQINGPNQGELAPIRADGEGHFEARGLRPGRWMVYASNDREGSFGRIAETIQLAHGQHVEVTIEIAYAASISGRVVDQTGAPVSGVTVVFKHTESDDQGIATTAIDGAFRAASLTGGGQYRPDVRRNLMADRSLPPVAGAQFPLLALADGSSEVTGLLLAVQIDHLAIAGKVVDSDGAPVPDARVVASTGDSGRGLQDPADTTTVDGQFSIGELLDGSYILRARSATGVEATLAGIKPGRTDITIVLPAAGGIDVTTTGFKTAPQVTAIRTGAADSSAPTVGVQDGATFTLRNLAPGSYDVIARTAGEAASAVVEVVAGRTAHATLASTSSGSVGGHVRDFKSGKPVEGMTCRALPRVGADLAPTLPGDGVRTDTQGNFAIAAAPAGAVAVVCGELWYTYSSGQRLITVTAGQHIDVDVPVVSTGEPPGSVISGFGADFADAGLVHVRPGGPAASAGFQNGDLIVTVDGASVTELGPDGVRMLIITRPAGSKVKLGATRHAASVTGEVTLGEAPVMGP